MANEFDKFSLKAKDKIVIELLESILEEIKLLRKDVASTKPSPS